MRSLDRGFILAIWHRAFNHATTPRAVHRMASPTRRDSRAHRPGGRGNSRLKSRPTARRQRRRVCAYYQRAKIIGDHGQRAVCEGHIPRRRVQSVPSGYPGSLDERRDLDRGSLRACTLRGRRAELQNCRRKSRDQAVKTCYRVDQIPSPADQPRRRSLDALIGKPAPEFPEGAAWLNSGPLTWESLRGKVVILDFWAEWCGPCRNDFPRLSRLHVARGSNGLTVVGIHPPGSKPEAIRKVMDEFHLGYPVCIDVPAGEEARAWGQLYRRFAVDLIPHAVAVDGRGIVIASGPLEDVLAKASALVKPR